jgi:thiamine pyrophosphate-dependent acetolactate synthase large subunit-like protein
MKGAEFFLETLVREGVDVLWGLTGSQFLDVLDLVREHPRLRFVLTRHEQGASYMAYGHAVARRGPSVCLSTVGPGATNLLSGVAAAHKSRVPILAYTAKQTRAYHQREMFQEIDQVRLYEPVAKWSYLPPTADKLPDALRKAFRLMRDRPRGPVHLNVMPELLRETVGAEPLDPSAYRADADNTPSERALRGVLEELRRARRPVIVAGADVIWDAAADALRRAAERLGIPVVTSLHNPDALPTTHPLGLGGIGPSGRRVANALLQQADTVLALGAALDFYSTAYGYRFLPREARLVHVSPVGVDVGAAFPVALGLMAPLGPFLEALAAAGGPISSDEWLGTVRALKQEHAAEVEDALAAPGSPLKPQAVVAALSRRLGADDVVVADSGNAMRYLRTSLETQAPGSFVDTVNWSAVGSGFPVAIGVRAARRAGRVVCVTGDGGFMMNVGELETSLRERLPVVTVVLNDNGFGNVRAYQQEQYAGRYIGWDFGNRDFARVAETLGAAGWRVERWDELGPALDAALAAERPSVVDVQIDPWELGATLHKAPG